MRDTVFPTTSIDPAVVADLWRAACAAYAAGIVPPSTTVAAASTALAATLTGVFSTGGTGPAKAAAMEAAFLAWATAIGLGMLPAFASTPPAGLIGFAAEFAKPPDQWLTTYALAAAFWSSAIDVWMKTGIATLVAPPNTPQLWA